MTSEREKPGDGRRVDAGLKLLDLACDDIKEAVYQNSLYGNEFDILALLVTIYCRRALAMVDPQEALEEYWPQNERTLGFRPLTRVEPDNAARHCKSAARPPGSIATNAFAVTGRIVIADG